MHYLEIKHMTSSSIMLYCLSYRSLKSETKCLCLHVLHSTVDVGEDKRDDAATLKEIFLLLTQSSEPNASDLQASSPPPDIHRSSAPPNIISASSGSSPPPFTQSISAPPSILHSSPSSSCSSSVCLDQGSSIPLTDRCVQHSSSTQIQYAVFICLQDPKKLCFLCFCISL